MARGVDPKPASGPTARNEEGLAGGEDDAAAARTGNLSNEGADGVLGRDGDGAEDVEGPPARKQAVGQRQVEDAREEEPVRPEDGGAELEGEL